MAMTLSRHAGTCGELFNRFWDQREVEGSVELNEDPPPLINSSSISGEAVGTAIE